MNKSSQTHATDDSAEGEASNPGQSLQENQDIETTFSIAQDRNLFGLVDDSSVDGPRRRPGAHAIRGVAESLSLASSEDSNPEPDDVAAQPGVLWTAQSAQLVDEAAEEERRQRYERESRRNRELES